MKNKLFGFKYLFINKEAKKAKLLPFDNKYEIFKSVSNRIINKARIKLDVNGSNYVPLYDGCLFVGNHVSILDFVFLTCANPNSSLFVVNECDSKNRKLKNWYQQLETLVSTNQVVNKLEQVLKSKKNIICFPEENINQTKTLLDFKPNYFVGCINAKAPIVPFVIRINTKNHVNVEFLQPIHYEEYSNYSLNELINKVFSLIQETL